MWRDVVIFICSQMEKLTLGRKTVRLNMVNVFPKLNSLVLSLQIDLLLLSTVLIGATEQSQTNKEILLYNV